jgi:nicotinamidase-related amidase
MRGQISWQDPTWPGAIPWLEISTGGLGLIVVDVQYSSADPERTPLRPGRTEQSQLFDAWAVRVRDQLLPNTRRLLAWFRDHGRPAIFTRVGSLLPDAQDQHQRRRLAWLRASADRPPYRSPIGSHDYEILPEIAPLPDELVIDKNTSGAFNSSPIDFYLQGMGLQTLVVCGVSTFACVDNTARDAADRSYNVILVEDACAGAAGSEAAHDATLRTFGRYLGAVKSTEQLLSELDALHRGRSEAEATDEFASIAPTQVARGA